MNAEERPSRRHGACPKSPIHCFGQLGIELAEEATRQLMKAGAAAAARVAFHEADLRAHPLHDATVVWYGPQPDTATIIAPELLPRLRRERPVGSTTRLLMTGAFLPPESEGACLTRAFLFLKRDSIATQEQLQEQLLSGDVPQRDFAVLYGGKRNGRRLVVEYLIEDGG